MNKLLPLIVILLAGCATTPQPDVGICDAHGGVHSINKNQPHVDVYCNDGTYHRHWNR